ncbi:MAG: HAD family hydrolase [Deltaproteobacteria bacterium]|nr:HAD family hydrolase [Deltaproteobacteria bacterium]
MEMKAEAIIFDFDGTLVHLNIDFKGMREDVEEIIGKYDVEVGSLRDLYILEMIDRARDLVMARSLSAAPSLYEEAQGVVREYEVRAAKAGKVIEGVPQMLRKLASMGIKRGVITRNCDEAVREVFPDIEAFCDVFISRDVVKAVKPHPAHLGLALERLHVKDGPGCLMIGDHVMDIEAGKHHSLKVAGVLTGKTTTREFLDAGADFVMGDVTEIFEYVQ